MQSSLFVEQLTTQVLGAGARSWFRRNLHEQQTRKSVAAAHEVA